MKIKKGKMKRMTQIVTGVVMAGGTGERFWPKSRLKMSKQFLNLYGDKTMIQHTVERLKRIIPVENIFVVTNEDYVRNFK